MVKNSIGNGNQKLADSSWRAHGGMAYQSGKRINNGNSVSSYHAIIIGIISVSVSSSIWRNVT